MLHRLTAACASGAGRDCSYNLAGNRRRPEAESVAKNWIFGNHPTRSWKNHSCRSPGAWTHRRHSGLNPRPPIAANRKSDRVARGPPANLEPRTSNLQLQRVWLVQQASQIPTKGPKSALNRSSIARARPSRYNRRPSWHHQPRIEATAKLAVS